MSSISQPLPATPKNARLALRLEPSVAVTHPVRHQADEEEGGAENRAKGDWVE
jgi:hypothetical protein